MAEATWKRRQATAGALQIVKQAEAGARETFRQAEASQAVFLARHAQRNRLSTMEELHLLVDCLRAVLERRPPAAAYRDYQNARQAQLALQASLTDFRLFWDALSRALAGRDKVLIDAENLPGRRQLWLVDPDQFRIPVPMLRPERRGSPRDEIRDDGP